MSRRADYLAHALLVKGKEAKSTGADACGETSKELIAYSRSVLDFVHHVLDIAASYNVRIIASVVDIDAPRPELGRLRKDYVYLFERYFYLLERTPPSERGLVVFDELDKAKSHVLISQMAAYFLGTETGRYRSSRIVPEPFFVHSELTTGIFLADLAAYILGWGWRLKTRMNHPCREELHPTLPSCTTCNFMVTGQKRPAMVFGPCMGSSTSTICEDVLINCYRRRGKSKRRKAMASPEGPTKASVRIIGSSHRMSRGFFLLPLSRIHVLHKSFIK